MRLGCIQVWRHDCSGWEDELWSWQRGRRWSTTDSVALIWERPSSGDKLLYSKYLCLGRVLGWCLCPWSVIQQVLLLVHYTHVRLIRVRLRNSSISGLFLTDINIFRRMCHACSPGLVLEIPQKFQSCPGESHLPLRTAFGLILALRFAYGKQQSSVLRCPVFSFTS